MSFSDHWNLVDVFTLEQAAYLWCEREPRMITADFTSGSGAKAMLQAFIGAIKQRELTVDHSTNALAQIGEYRTSMVSREALVRYARSRNTFPKFLFDTFEHDEAVEEAEGGTEIDKTRAAIQELLKDVKRAPSQASRPSSPDPSPEAPPTKVGRPEGYDWNACMGEIIRLADMDGLPAIQADLVRHLMGWFEERFGKSPADSVIKSRISPLYKYLASVGWKSRNG